MQFHDLNARKIPAGRGLREFKSPYAKGYVSTVFWMLL
jgi:hypothetical protein